MDKYQRKFWFLNIIVKSGPKHCGGIDETTTEFLNTYWKLVQ